MASGPVALKVVQIQVASEMRKLMAEMAEGRLSPGFSPGVPPRMSAFSPADNSLPSPSPLSRGQPRASPVTTEVVSDPTPARPEPVETAFTQVVRALSSERVAATSRTPQAPSPRVVESERASFAADVTPGDTQVQAAAEDSGRTLTAEQRARVAENAAVAESDRRRAVEEDATQVQFCQTSCHLPRPLSALAALRQRIDRCPLTPT